MQTQSTRNFIFTLENSLEEDTFLDLTFLTSTLKNTLLSFGFYCNCSADRYESNCCFAGNPSVPSDCLKTSFAVVF